MILLVEPPANVPRARAVPSSARWQRRGNRPRLGWRHEAPRLAPRRSLACSPPARSCRARRGPQELFWDAAAAPCAAAPIEGRVVTTDPGDSEMAAARLVIHVARCDAGAVRIAFHVGADRSRVWVIARTADGPQPQARPSPRGRQRGRAQPLWRRHGRRPAAPRRQEFPADRILARPLRAREHPRLDHQYLGDRDRAGPRPSPMSSTAPAATSGSSSTSAAGPAAAAGLGRALNCRQS